MAMNITASNGTTIQQHGLVTLQLDIQGTKIEHPFIVCDAD